ncbi:MAG: hypothetical protein MI974_14315 [Chitinophagales bacterium]|nr:hypothetical protein [Chitinophagales bacterium]
MTLLRFLLLIGTISILASCTKADIITDENEKANPVKEDQVIDFLPLEVGAYWVYEGRTTNLSTGETTPIGKHDSLYISGDTLIDAHQYFIIEGTRLGNQVHDLVCPIGTDLLGASNHLIFSLDQYKDTVNWPVSLLPEGVEELKSVLHPESSISVPVGKFEAIVYDMVFYYPMDNNTYQGESVIYESNWIGKNVGPVKFTRMLPEHQILIEMELIRTSVY